MALVYSSNDQFPEEGDATMRLHSIKLWLLDMDGTVTLGESIIEGTERFFSAISGTRYIFLTNNSSHSSQHYIDRMNNLGIATTRSEVLTSTDALIKSVKSEFGENIRAFVVGTPDFESELFQGGIKVIKENDSSIVDVVLVGFDTTLTYSKLNSACKYIRQGIPWYAANPDKVCPLADGNVLPDCGAIIAFLQTCTGISPRGILGKPDTALIDMAISLTGALPNEIAMIGDRIYTDMVAAKNAGIMCIGVLTGEASLEDIRSSAVDPDFVFDNIGDIADYL